MAIRIKRAKAGKSAPVEAPEAAQAVEADVEDSTLVSEAIAAMPRVETEDDSWL